MKLKVVIHAGQPPARCRAFVPVLPGCVSEGDTPEEALANLRAAIAAYTDASQPQERGGERIEEIELAVPADEPATPTPDGLAPAAPPNWRRFLLAHGGHEGAAVTALTAGLFAALVAGALGLAPLWAGFLAGYLTVAALAALTQTAEIG